MAQKRMFSKSITNSSQFLMMPASSQCLYYHLGMNADDDGYCEHFSIMRMTDSKPDDLRLLQVHNFVKVFDDKVLIITHWKENNLIRSDRYTPSKYLEIYKDEIKQISGIPKGNQLVYTGKVSKGKVSKGKVIIENDNKDIYGEIKNVYLTKDEYDNLITDYGEDNIREYIDRLSLYHNIKKYKDHNLTIRSWLNKDKIQKRKNLECPQNLLVGELMAKGWEFDKNLDEWKAKGLLTEQEYQNIIKRIKVHSYKDWLEKNKPEAFYAN